MSETGITEKILFEMVARFQGADPDNSVAAERLREGIAEGNLRDSEWIASVLSLSDSSAAVEEP